MNIINPYRYGGLTQILDIENEWFMPNVQNADGNIITIPDSGSIGGVNLNNPALSNKPTAKTINGFKSYKGDAIDDIITKNVTNFGRSYSGWMANFVINYDASSVYRMLTCFNTANPNKEGFEFIVTTDGITMHTFNSAGTSSFPISFGSAIGSGKILIIFAYTGTNIQLYMNGILRVNAPASNPLLIPTATTNLSLIGRIATSSNTLISTLTDEGYASFGSYNSTKLTNNSNTLKALYGIAW